MTTPEDMMRVHDKFAEVVTRDNVRKSSAYFSILSVRPCPACKHQPRYREGPPETLVMCDHFIAEMKRKCSEQVSSAGPWLFWCGFAVERPSD